MRVMILKGMVDAQIINWNCNGNFKSQQSSTPCDMRFSPSDTGKMATLRGSASKWPFSPYRVGKITYRKGLEDWGSLMSVP